MEAKWRREGMGMPVRESSPCAGPGKTENQAALWLEPREPLPGG